MRTWRTWATLALAGVALLLVGVVGSGGVAAQTVSTTATVTMTDNGFSPAGVTIPLGGTVVWRNQGNKTHSAATVGGAPTTFSTPGVGPGQTASVVFTIPGNYYYTSAADCVPSLSPVFPCTISYLVTVLGPGGVPPTATPDPNALPVVPPGAKNVTVTIDDAVGFVPPTVTIPMGGTITWNNRGGITHSATSIGSAPIPFGTAGIGAGESISQQFATPGLYFYTSGMDCAPSAPLGFPCNSSYLIVVAGPGGMVPTPTSVPTNNTAPVVVPVAVPNANVDLTDAGFFPPIVQVGLSGVVTWTNRGKNVHSVTTTSDTNTSLPSFDSGGLAPDRSFSMAFGTPGVYTYLSGPDCASGVPIGFNCRSYAVIVGSAPLTLPTAVPPTPTSTPPTVPGSAVVITIDDTIGFTPSDVNIKPGQTVTWVNVGSNVHSVVVNQNPLGVSAGPPFWLPYALPSNTNITFDSGGLGPGQSYSFNFAGVGTYPYHSSIERQFWMNNPNCGCTITTYQFFGNISVSLTTPTPTTTP